MRLFSIFITSFLAWTLQSQTLTGDYTGFLYQDYYVAAYKQGKYIAIDSFTLDQQGKFSIPIKLKEGVSIIVTSKEELKRNKSFARAHVHNSIRLVYNGGNLSYKTSWRNESGYLKILEGGMASEHIFYLSEELNKTQAKIDKIEQLMYTIHPTDDLYVHLQHAYRDYLQNFNLVCDSIAIEYNSDSYMNTYACMYKQVIPPTNYSIDQIVEWKSKHLFDFVNLQNAALADIPLLKGMYQGYLFYNQPKGLVAQNEIQRKKEEAINRLKSKSCNAIQLVLEMQPKSRIEQQRDYFIKKVNFEEIAQNEEEWFSSINQALEVYVVGSPYHQKFGADAITNLMRIDDKEVYTKFAEAAISICEQFNWGKDQEQIVDFLITDDQLVNPKGKLKQLAVLRQIRIGQKAPDLILTEHVGNFEEHNHQQTVLSSTDLSDQYSLLVFYKSGCGPCEHTMTSLKNNYANLSKQGIEIISLAADTDPQTFADTAGEYPWSKKYCDFKGLDGSNFQNYAVLGTPTMYLLDNQGIIQAKLATVEELLSWMKNPVVLVDGFKLQKDF